MTGPLVDSHQHFWQLSRGDYAWLTPELKDLYRDFLPQDLSPLLREAKIERTIVVQAAPTDKETEFLLGLARQSEFIAGVIGWVDMAAPRIKKRIKQLARDPWLKGFRPMIQDIADDDWMLSTELAPAFEAIIEHDLVFEALVFPRHLNNLLTLLTQYPDLKCVINHGAKPDIANDTWQPWADDIAALANHTNAYCKLSGLLTEAGSRTDYESLKPYMTHLFEQFGGQRLIWGSDWPVLTLASDYRTWYSMALVFIRETHAEVEADIMGGNATRLYQLSSEEDSK